jgi:catechol 2,3-dioxygenase-like lactoylglutathione lyase family enzyme
MIQHVARQVGPDRLDRCVSFYELLGFERIEPPDSLRGRAVWLEQGGTQLHLLPVVGAEPERGHIAIVPSIYDDVLDALRAAGHDPEPRREHWGSPRAYVRDPAGNLVELMAFAPERRR